MSAVPIGTLIKGAENPGAALRALAPAGFEGFSVMFWDNLGGADLAALARELRAAAEETGTRLTSLSVYGNPLRPDAAGERTLADFAALVRAAPDFGCSLVSGFAGRVPGCSVPDSIPAWKEAFAPIVEEAHKLGVALAFENCRLGDTWKTGKWNLAINPDAWNLMFDALGAPNVGLEWEPCHQVEALADPLAQLRAWAPRVFHVHGKDARTDRALLAERGLYGERKWHESCFPGNGDTPWTEVFSILAEAGYPGWVDVEGWNDAAWSGEKEIPGQIRALDYLKGCRARSEAASAASGHKKAAGLGRRL